MKKGIVFFSMVFFLTATVFAQNEPVENQDRIANDSAATAPAETDNTENSKNEPAVPVQVKKPTPEPDEFFLPDPSTPPEETEESLRAQLDANRRDYITYATLQYTSIGIAALGLMMVILDAFIDTGSEYPYTPIPTDTNPNPSAVTTAFGNLSIAGAVVAAVGAGTSIGFQFPYRKYRNRKYILQNRLRDLETLNETETGLEEIIKEVVVD